MLILTYSKESAPSAMRIAEESGEQITPHRGSRGDVNWGRATADTILNPDISTVTNKRVMRELFRDHSVPAPELMNVAQASLYVDSGGTVIGRPDKHSRKRGFWLCKTMDDVQRALRGTRIKQPASHFMQFIEHDAEFRVHIFRGRSIRMSQKKFAEGSDRLYTMIKPTGDVRAVRRAAKAAVKAVGLDFGAVDVLRAGDQVYVLEVNAAPGLGGSMPRVWAERFIKWKERRDVRD